MDDFIDCNSVPMGVEGVVAVKRWVWDLLLGCIFLMVA